MRKTAAFWTDDLFNKFVKVAMLNDEESRIIWLRIHQYTLIEIAEDLGVSISTVSRRLRILKDKYDSLSAEGYGFPPRLGLIKMDRM